MQWRGGEPKSGSLWCDKKLICSDSPLFLLCYNCNSPIWVICKVLLPSPVEHHLLRQDNLHNNGLRHPPHMHFVNPSLLIVSEVRRQQALLVAVTQSTTSGSLRQGVFHLFVFRTNKCKFLSLHRSLMCLQIKEEKTALSVPRTQQRKKQNRSLEEIAKQALERTV